MKGPRRANAAKPSAHAAAERRPPGSAAVCDLDALRRPGQPRPRLTRRSSQPMGTVPGPPLRTLPARARLLSQWEQPASPSRRGGTGRGAGARDRSGAALSRHSVPVSVVSAPAQPNRRTMGTLGARRGLEWLLGFYFLSHIPITLLMDLQGVLPRDLYPVEVRAPSVPVAGVGVPRRSGCPSVPITSPPRPLSLPLSLGSAGALYLDILGFSLFLPAASPRLRG